MAAEPIELTNFGGDESPKLKAASAPPLRRDFQASLPYNNPFLLIVVMLMNDMQVQKEGLFASFSEQQVLQQQYANQTKLWQQDCETQKQCIANAPNSPETKTMNIPGIIGMVIGILVALIGVLMCIPIIGQAVAGGLSAVAAALTTTLVGAAASLAVVGGTTLAACAGSGVGDFSDKTPGGKDLTGSLHDDTGATYYQQALSNAIQSDQTTVQNLQNQMSQLVQVKISPSQDMQTQDGQMIQNALRLMATSVMQLPV